MRTLLAVLLCLAVPVLAQTVDGGKFGRALSLHNTAANAPTHPVYTVIPITVECWAKLPSKEQYNILVANEVKHSGTHWELYSEKSSGTFSAYLTQWKPGPVKSDVVITDNQWHYLAMTFDGTTVKLYVDGKEVASQKVAKEFHYPDSTPLTLGYVEGLAGQPGALLDEVRISRVLRPIEGLPKSAFAMDPDTIALWHFNEPADATVLVDSSRTGNDVQLNKGDEKTGFGESNNRWMQMDFGPFFSATYPAGFPGPNLTNKGIAVRLGKDREAAVCFDTELLRPAVAWTGDFIRLTPTREGLAGPPAIAGKTQWGTLPKAGWSTSETFDDPRPLKMGSLPREVGRYRGLYVHGQRIVFAYRVHAVDVLDSYGLEAHEGATAFTRTIEIAKRDKALNVRLLDLPGKGDIKSLEARGSLTSIQVIDLAGRLIGIGAGGGGELITTPEHIALRFAPGEAARAKVIVWTGEKGQLGQFEALAAASAKADDLAALTRGGPAQYPDAIVTQGTLGADKEAYTVDTLTAPEENPWKSFLRFGGHDFFKNGDIAICSISGDVWIVSGIDAKLQSLKWRRFATGLFQPLGLRIIDEKVYICGRDQITRLHDLNNDGEADFYENFNNDAYVTPNGHAYVSNLETDPEGNFYFIKCGDNTPHGGTVLKVSRDGEKLEVFAVGLRNPNGLGVSPRGEVYEADNQGEWVPASRLDLVTRGAFLGFPPMSKTDKPPTHPGKPLCWMPQNVDNSSSSQCWVTSNQFGPLNGAMLHTSYGAATLLVVLPETVNGQVQGGVWRLPLSFATGVMRARTSPVDGQVYLSGLRGWQTAGARSGALQRVRYTGKKTCIPIALHVHKNGIRLSFSEELDAETAGDGDAWTVLQWNYRWTSAYGSRHWSVKEPEKQGYDELEIKSAKVLADKRTVFLEIADLGPAMQMRTAWQFESAAGATVKGEIHNTIHELGEVFDAKGR